MFKAIMAKVDALIGRLEWTNVKYNEHPKVVSVEDTKVMVNGKLALEVPYGADVIVKVILMNQRLESSSYWNASPVPVVQQNAVYDEMKALTKRLEDQYDFCYPALANDDCKCCKVCVK